MMPLEIRDKRNPKKERIYKYTNEESYVLEMKKGKWIKKNGVMMTLRPLNSNNE